MNSVEIILLSKNTVVEEQLLTMSDTGLEAQEVRKKTLACNRKQKQRLAASAKERSTESSKQRKQMRVKGKGLPARQSAGNTNHTG